MELERMQKNYGYFGGLCLLYGILFTVCLYHNLNGITYPVWVLAMGVIAYLMVKKPGMRLKTSTLLSFVGMLLLGVGTAITTSWFLIFFNLVGILLLFLTGMMHQCDQRKENKFFRYLKNILNVCLKTLKNIFKPFAHGFRFFGGVEEGRRKKFTAVGAGVLIAAVLLIFIFPMLMESDLIFAGIFESAFQNIRFGTFFGILCMILTGFVSSYAFVCGLGEEEKRKEESEERNKFNSLIGITFTSILAVIYGMYAGIQILYLFLRIGGLPEGITYAEYARQGFFELLFVAVVNFILVLACMQLFEKNRVLYGILTVISVCTFVMTASAAYRMILYVQAYHLTFLRVLVLWFLAVLALIMAGVTLSIYRPDFPLAGYVMAVVGCGYILFALARPDRLIVEYNLSHMETVSREDFYYMLYGLSDDAAPVIAELDLDLIAESYGEAGWAKQELDNYFQGLSDRYENLSFREWNLSKYQAEQAAETWNRTVREW